VISISTKTFDTISREALWQILLKFGCPDKFVNIKSFHEGMFARVVDRGTLLEPFSFIKGTKQGCVLALLLFLLSIFYVAMLIDALIHNDKCIQLQYRTNGGIFNLQRLQVKTNVVNLLARDFLYADDCALAADKLEGAQEIVNCFANSASRFGLSINIKMIEVICQSHPNSTLQIINIPLVNVDKFCHLGTSDVTIDEDVTQILAKATQAFGRLKLRLWNDHDIKLQTSRSARAMTDIRN